MSCDYIKAVLQTALPRPEKLVCLAIAWHVDKLGEGCYASYQTLADETSYDERQVIRIVATLEEAGIVVFQRRHPRYGTNIWNIDIKKLTPRPKPGRKQAKPARRAAGNGSAPSKAAGLSGDAASEREHAGLSADDATHPQNVTPAEDSATHSRACAVLDSDATARDDVTPEGDKTGQPGVSKPDLEAQNLSPYLSSGKGSLEREKKGPAAHAAAPQLTPVARVPDSSGAVSATGKARALDDAPRAREPADDAKARERPETDLQRKIVDLCNARYLSAEMKAKLDNPVTTRYDKHLPQKYPSPEDEWQAYPTWFSEYVELCATRIWEESSRPPGREMLIKFVRNYGRYGTGWLDFKAGKRRIEPEPGRYQSVIGDGLIDGNALFDAIIAAEREKRNAHESPQPLHAR